MDRVSTLALFAAAVVSPVANAQPAATIVGPWLDVVWPELVVLFNLNDHSRILKLSFP